MSAVAIQFLDQGLHRVIFDAMPMPVFVVDEDVSILEYNSAAAALIGGSKRAVLQRKGGEVLHCVHAAETPRGCGHSKACPACVIRNSVNAASRGQAVAREPAELELWDGAKRVRLKVKVSTQPFSYEKHSFVLLVLEGLNDKARKRGAARRAHPH